jgi:hypothetical protein
VFCTVYLDNIIIYSKDLLQYTEHVCKVLEQLRKAGLQANIKKSEFQVTKTKFLRFIVSTKGIEIDLAKIEVIKD